MMSEISEKAKDMILRYGAARVDAYGENDDFLDELEENEFESLCSYIAALEAEVEALRPFRDGYDPKERLPDRARCGHGATTNVFALLDLGNGYLIRGRASYSFETSKWMTSSLGANVVRWYPLPETEHKPDPLEGVPYVSLSNAEIAAMTPEHPLYKLVKGDRKCKDE